MDVIRTAFSSKGQIVIPAELRKRHKIRAGTRVAIFEDPLGRIVLQPITEDYITRMRGVIAAEKLNLLETWESEHRIEGEKDKF
jgi:AbrB family looped-hinge helix DNA binding protein